MKHSPRTHRMRRTANKRPSIPKIYSTSQMQTSNRDWRNSPLPAALVRRTANCDYTTSVIVITDRNRNFGLNDFVKHRGIRYARGYSYSWQKAAGREESFRHA